MLVQLNTPNCRAEQFDPEKHPREILGAYVQKVKEPTKWYCPSHGVERGFLCDELGCTVFNAPEYLLRTAGKYKPLYPGAWIVAVPNPPGSVYSHHHEVLSEDTFNSRYKPTQ